MCSETLILGNFVDQRILILDAAITNFEWNGASLPIPRCRIRSSTVRSTTRNIALAKKIATKGKKWPISPKVIFWAGVGMICLGSGWVIFAPSPKKSALAGIECVLSGNGGCVYDLTPIEERSAYGMTREQYSQLLNGVILPNIRSAGRQTEIEVTLDGVFHATHEVVTPRGRRVQLASQSTTTPDGIKNPMLLTIAFLAASMSESDGGSGVDEKFICQKKFILKNREWLDQVGMHGLYRGPKEGLITWDKWIENCDESIRFLSEKNR